MSEKAIDNKPHSSTDMLGRGSDTLPPTPDGSSWGRDDTESQYSPSEAEDDTIPEQGWVETFNRTVAAEIRSIRDKLSSSQEWSARSLEQQKEMVNSILNLRKYIESPLFDRKTAAEFVQAVFEISDNMKKNRLTERYPILDLEHLHPEILEQLYFSQPSDEEWRFREAIENIKDTGVLARIVYRAYESTGKEVDPGDTLVRRIDNYYKDKPFLLDIDLISNRPADFNDFSVVAFNEHTEKKTIDLLKRWGFPDALCESYWRQIKLRDSFVHEDIVTSCVDGTELKMELRTIRQHILNLGINNLLNLYREIGTENFWAYSNDELTMMHKLFVQNDQSTIEHLKQGDVTVELISARNDYNKAVINEGDLFGKESGRTLRFEIKHPSDIYRYMALLSRLNIKPSVFVITAHGLPGEIPIESTSILSYDKSSPHDSESNNEEGVDISKSAFWRMVRDYMKPNNNLEDTALENIGKIQIIIATCDGATQPSIGGVRYPSLDEVIGTQLTRTGVDADIYAAPGKVSFDKDEMGNVVFKLLELPHGGRVDRGATRHEVRGGGITRSNNHIISVDKPRE